MAFSLNPEIAARTLGIERARGEKWSQLFLVCISCRLALKLRDIRLPYEALFLFKYMLPAPSASGEIETGRLARVLRKRSAQFHQNEDEDRGVI
jgi:hypothetical protein